MGRYSSVQAYADNNANMRSVPYAQASGTADTNRAPAKAPKPEKVVNPYGSTAGAGSGEFHLYRSARSREMQRMEQLDEEEKERVEEEKFQTKLKADREEEMRKTEQRKKKRKREKEAKARKKALRLGGVAVNATTSDGAKEHSSKQGVNSDESALEKKEGDKIKGGEEDEEEFTYKPIYKVSSEAEIAEQEPAPPAPFANDGSFLEMMKKKLEAESANANKETSKET